MSVRSALLNSWEKPNYLTVLLWPLSVLYRLLFQLRGCLYSLGALQSLRAPVPVIVVGNLTVGGTGTTPMVIYLVEQLRERGFNPGVISRGYQSNSGESPVLVKPDADVQSVGDEPLLIVQRTGVPLVIGRNRAKSIQALLQAHPIDVVISDDGLQHLAIQRDIEICLIDKTSPQANTCLLPAGPYREPLSRLESVDYVVHHGGDQHDEYVMQLKASAPKPLVFGNARAFDSSAKLHAIAGIGNPQRFFNTCRELGYRIECHEFPDHHQFEAQEVSFSDQQQVLMTEKDAVKVRPFATQRHWFLPVDAKLSGNIIDEIESQLKRSA